MKETHREVRPFVFISNCPLLANVLAYVTYTKNELTSTLPLYLARLLEQVKINNKMCKKRGRGEAKRLCEP